MIHIDQESDYVPKRLVRRSSVVVIAGIIVSVIATIVVAGGHLVTALRVAGKPPARVEMTPFALPTAGELLRVRAEMHLQTYGWVDRATGTIHVPLDVAIELYLGAQR